MKTAKKSPMRKRWESLKKENPGCLILMGFSDGWYEAFAEDAERMHEVLSIPLTVMTSSESVAMTGFPKSDLDRHLSKLVENRIRVAVVEPDPNV